ncbi:MAG TPA: hypothetical protein VE732_02690 [Nitrososphaera sp.]|nr:hypothetical protein [Nitrososphaera sp.]
MQKRAEETLDLAMKRLLGCLWGRSETERREAMNQVSKWIRRLGLLLLILSFPVTMGWCAVRIHNLPLMDYRVERDVAGKIIFLQTAPILLVAVLLIVAIIRYDEALERERVAQDYRAWQERHTHTWKGCECQNPKCSETRHNLNESCECSNCGGSFHLLSAETYVGDFGSSAIVSQMCTRCEQEFISSHYVG